MLTCFVSFLKCRFGKVLWKHIPTQRRGSLEDEVFKEFCLDPTHSRIFAPEYVHISIIIYTMQNHNDVFSVQQRSADIIKVKFTEEKVSFLETFDVKLTIKGERKRNAIDIRVKFEQGKPKVLLAKKNEENIVVFDVVHPHRLAIIIRVLKEEQCAKFIIFIYTETMTYEWP